MLVNELSALKREAKGKPILISDELFSGYAFWAFSNRGVIAKRIAESIPEAEIILFLRNQVDLIDSLYNQHVKIDRYYGMMDSQFLHENGDGLTLKEYIDGKRDWNISRRKFNHQSVFSPLIFSYSNTIKLYKSLFNKVHIFLYEDFKKEQEIQIERLASILSVDFHVSSQDKKERLNRSLSDNELSARILNNKISAIMGHSAPKLRAVFLRFFSQFFKSQTRSERINYINSVLENAGIFQDNSLLTKTYPNEVPLLND